MPIVTVDPDLCHGCGNCKKKCPQVFKVGKVASVENNPVPIRHRYDCIDAAEKCPAHAIKYAEATAHYP